MGEEGPSCPPQLQGLGPAPPDPAALVSAFWVSSLGLLQGRPSLGLGSRPLSQEGLLSAS